MSDNSQILIKEHNGKFYVFDVQAESWSDKNELSVKEAKAVCDSWKAASEKAKKIANENWDEGYPNEYGIVDDILYKDGADVTIIN